MGRHQVPATTNVVRHSPTCTCTCVRFGFNLKFGTELFSYPIWCKSNLWFDYGYLLEVHNALTEGIRTIDIDTRLQVRQTHG